MHSFELKAEKYIEKHNMLSPGDRVVLGVSGGADSTALFFVMLGLKDKYDLNLTVVHVNHKLREEAEAEAMTVKALCDKNKVRFILREYDVETLAKENKKSCEEMGRELRYKAFSEATEGNDCKIAVAHNMNDQSETMLFNLFRGTGITGLSSIAPVRGNIIRPLLGVTRKEIEEYLSDLGISFCTDKSNFTNDYTRNRIRNNILPQVETDVSGKAIEHMAVTAGQLRELNDYVTSQAVCAYNECLIRQSDEEVVFNKDSFDSLHIYLRKQLIKLSIDALVPNNKDITSAHIESVAALPKGQGYKEVNLPYGLIGYVSYNETGVKKDVKQTVSKSEYSVVIEGETDLTEGRYVRTSFADREEFTNGQKLYTKFLSYDTITTRLVVRTRRDGDYIVVNSDGGRKKLKDYFIDEKIPAGLRDSVLLLADGNRIMWVIGYRIGEDCKVTDKTQKIIKITYLEDK